MTPTQTIKAAGFTAKKFKTEKRKGYFGESTNHVIGLFNSNNEVLCHDGKPYFPIGERHTFATLISTGDIKAECFTFKPWKYVDGRVVENMSEEEMIAKVTERSKEMLANPEIEALYRSQESEEAAKSWLFHQALITLMYTPQEREAMAAKKLNQKQ